MAKVIEPPTAEPGAGHNKTLAARSTTSSDVLFPENAVEYFVSYYDTISRTSCPRARLHREDATVNDELDKLRRGDKSLFEAA